jgi:hypothetical protein
MEQFDVLRAAALVECLGEIVFLVCFFALYEAQRQYMVSDTLFADPAYRITLTVLLSIRMLFAVLYLHSRSYAPVQSKQREGLRAWLGVGYGGVLLAFFGWLWLSLNEEETRHTAGVLIFAVGLLLNSTALVRLARLTDDHVVLVHYVLDTGLACVAVALGVSFMAMWQAGSPATFVVEHVAFLAYLSFWFVFFYYHFHQYSFPSGTRGEKYCVPMVVQCQPLLAVPYQEQA